MYDQAHMTMTRPAVGASDVCFPPQLSTGKERDSESGNDYFGARYYGSSMGRFLSPDPAGVGYADPSNPQSLNLYSYVYNNPLINIDPSGMECVWDDGSYDASDDRQTSSAKGCSGQGGTWVDPSLFESVEGNKPGSWSGQGSSQMQFDWLTPSSTTSADISATPTLSDASAFYQMWLSGAGPASIEYGPNDGATQQLEQTPTARGLQQKYINAGCPSSATYPSGHIGPWLHGYGTLNPTEMQVGGFTENITTSGGTTTFAITNTAGQGSYSGATTSPKLARLNPFNRNGTSNNPHGPNGPRHNINQTFSWTEPNPCGH